jgi:hypothetical protein
MYQHPRNTTSNTFFLLFFVVYELIELILISAPVWCVRVCACMQESERTHTHVRGHEQKGDERQRQVPDKTGVTHQDTSLATSREHRGARETQARIASSASSACRERRFVGVAEEQRRHDTCNTQEIHATHKRHDTCNTDATAEKT